MAIKTPLFVNLLLSFGDTLFPLFEQACSVHLGVTTTGIYAMNPAKCQVFGALVRADAGGSPCIFIDGHPYATLADFTNPASLGCIFSVGTAGNTNEQPIGALLDALSSLPAIACNDGFRRPNANLVVMLVTDEDDDDNDSQGNSGSLLDPPQWFKSVEKLTGSNNYMIGIIGDESEMLSKCTWNPVVPQPDGIGVEPTPNLHAFMQLFPEQRRALASLCQPNPAPIDAYDPVLVEAAAELTSLCGG